MDRIRRSSRIQSSILSIYFISFLLFFSLLLNINMCGSSTWDCKVKYPIECWLLNRYINPWDLQFLLMFDIFKSGALFSVAMGKTDSRRHSPHSISSHSQSGFAIPSMTHNFRIYTSFGSIDVFALIYDVANIPSKLCFLSTMLLHVCGYYVS